MSYIPYIQDAQVPIEIIHTNNAETDQPTNYPKHGGYIYQDIYISFPDKTTTPGAGGGVAGP